MGSSSVAQGDQLGALRRLRGVGWGGWEGGSRGRGYGDMCMHMADSLCCAIETNTILRSNYIPIKMYLKNNNKKKKKN